MTNRLVEYIENSFLKALLSKEGITDITYNGESLFYLHNTLGRKKSEIKITPKEASDFIRQIANLSERQFSFSEPTLDVSIGRYRINAMHQSIVRVKDEKSISFAIRIASLENRIKNDKTFMPKDVNAYLIGLIKKHESIVIGGSTGSGKTELQKYLISQIQDNAHIIVIDNIQELESVRLNENVDITSWQVLPTMKERTFENLIRNALRNNPDWLVIAEARGKEMSDILLSTLSGHPVITTLHVKSIEEIPSRITRLVQLSNPNQLYSDIYQDVTTSMDNYVFLERVIDKSGNVHRYVKSVGKYSKEKRRVEVIYESK